MIRTFKIAFTGHRSSETPGRTAADLEAIRPLIREELARHQSPGAFLSSSAAEGADLIACEEALDCGIPLDLHLPFSIDEFREDFADRMEAWPRAAKIIERAQTAGHSLNLLDGKIPRPECYAAVNKQLLQDAQFLIAVTTDSPEKTGGSSEMVILAQKQRIPCVVIDPLHRVTMRV